MKARLPLDGTFELTPVCNMDCRMCYVRMSPAQQQAIGPLHTGEEWLELAHVCRDRGMVFLLLTGGEPLLHPDFIHVLTEINRMGIVTTVNTNGTLINESIVSDLRRAGASRLNITLYGASDETYDRLCGNPRGFSQVSNAVSLLCAAGIDVKINMSITPYNVDDLEQMLAWCKSRKLQVQCSTYMFPPIRKDGSRIGVNDRMTPQDAAYTGLMSDYYRMGRELFKTSLEAETYPRMADDDCMIPVEGRGVRCRAGGCTFWVTWNGVMMPCGIMPAEEGINAFEVGFDKAWEHVKAYTDAIRMPAKCAACPAEEHCHTCAAMCVSETGAYDIAPQYRCDMYQAYGQAKNRILESISQGEL